MEDFTYTNNVATTPSPKEPFYCSEQLLGSFIITSIFKESRFDTIGIFKKKYSDSKGNSKRKDLLFYTYRVGGREWAYLHLLVWRHEHRILINLTLPPENLSFFF